MNEDKIDLASVLNEWDKEVAYASKIQQASNIVRNLAKQVQDLQEELKTLKSEE